MIDIQLPLNHGYCQIFESLVNHEKITMEFNANVTEITENSVIYEKNGKVTEIPNDHVFAMIGYHPDYDFLESIGIEINTNEYGTAQFITKKLLRQMLKLLYCWRNCCR